MGYMLSMQSLEFSQSLLQLLVCKISMVRLNAGKKRQKRGESNTLDRQVVDDTPEAVASALFRAIKNLHLVSSVALLGAPIRKSSMMRLWRPWMSDSLLVFFPV
jgi:hypothetical protein